MEAIGILYLAILFIACFVFVAMVKLALLGLRSIKNKPESKARGTQKRRAAPACILYCGKEAVEKQGELRHAREIKFKEDK